MNEMQCRRKSERFEVNIEVDIEIPALDHKSKVITRDLSKGGICFNFHKSLNLGEQIHLGLSLILGPEAQSETLTLNANVAWCAKENEESHQIGVSFTDISEEKISNLDTFIDLIKEGFEFNNDK